MKVLHINNTDNSGGAAIAARRIHKSLFDSGIHSRMLVNIKNSDDWTINGPKGKLKKGFAQLRRHIVRPFLKTLKTENKILHSPAFLPSAWNKKINNSDADVTNLHWIGGEMASISDVGKITKPVVWTLHDMWAFCGAEHISWDQRWQEGYSKKNRPSSERGIDINRWTWKRKLKHWKRPFHVVAVSNWLAECAQKSVIMKDWPISVIPNCLNTKIWKPVDKTFAREMLGLPAGVPIVAFGSYGANSEYHKGFDLLVEALKNLNGEVNDMQLAIFGQTAPKVYPKLGFDLNFMGHFYDEISLCLLYSAADILVVPSRLEAFGQTASESMACATPVVAFGTSGLLDIVDHKVNGYLAKPFETEDLANGIKYVLNASNYEQLCKNARKKSVKWFDSALVAAKYEELYKTVIK